MNKQSIDIKAIKKLDQALKYKADGDLLHARELLLDLVANYDNYAAAYNNLGAIYFAEQKWQAAREAYQSAIIAQADYADAYYNLGLVQKKLGMIDEAVTTYEALMQLNDKHAGAHFQLASLFMLQSKFPLAIRHFQELILQFPEHIETLINIGICYMHLGSLTDAREYFLQSLSLAPENEQVLFNLGVIAMQQNYLEEAVHYYQRLVHLQPDDFAANNNMAVCYLGLKQRKKALYYFREALRVQPQNLSIVHMVHALSQGKQDADMSVEFIQSLFDSYADHYDQHLNGALQYKVPQHFFQLLKNQFSDKLPGNSLDILDLGCGTGLCGVMVKTMAHHLTGVDLSAQMLAEASKKHIYDELVQADMFSFLADKKHCYDLILAGDVLVYAGKIDDLFLNLASSLRPGGFFIFNAEISPDQPCQLQLSGRFAHSQAYLDQQIKENGLRCIDYQTREIRTHDGKPVMAHIYLLQS